MKLGYVSLAGRGATDALIAAVAARLQSQGMRLAGTVQTNLDRPGSHLCDMDLLVLPGGPVLRINQELGESATGCRLDPGALEEAVALSAGRLDGAELVIVNKFGKHEAEGRGFRPLIGEAMLHGIPVLIGVNGLNLAAFQEFVGDLADHLAPDADQIVAWCRREAQKAASPERLRDRQSA